MIIQTGSINQAIDQAIGSVADFCALEHIDNYHETRLSLFIEELIANTFNHGYAPGESVAELVFNLERNDDLVTLTYRDKGIPFDPHSDLPEDDRSKELEERQVGGLGWALIFKLCERVEYMRDGDENKTILFRRIT